MITKLSLQQGDDMDFIPILPINEMGGDNGELVVPEEIPLLPLRNTVLFPGVVIPITVGREKSIKAVTDAYKNDKLVGVVAQKDSTTEEPSAADLEQVGTVARIVKLIKMPDGGTTVIIQGRKRFRVLNVVEAEPYFRARVEVLHDTQAPVTDQFNATISTIKDLAGQIIELSPNMPAEAAIILRNIEQTDFLIHFIASNTHSELGEKQQLLELDHIGERAELLLQLLQKELQFAELKNQVNTKTRTEIDKQQREYFLQQQLKSIKDELGGDLNDKELREMRKKAEVKKWPVAAKEAFTKGIEKLERMHPSTPDYSVAYNHLDLLLDLPWDEITEDAYDLKKAKKVLDNDHYGMSKVKERILEYL
ncbi:MAG: LON peptidase substrate-binding domain-containing protein, partial [Dinghuibacter sp.]|nr:LON peptidase substrate-binding domain-containing protein [Dinghuibacter sp.]